MSKWILIGPLVGVLLITLALVFGYVIVPPLIVERITESVQIVQGTEQYDRWREVPQPLDFKVYIFNVTNVEEVQQGLTPVVQEIGPYVYSQTRAKNHIRFSRDKERASYFSQMTFHFDKEKSAPLTEDDKIVVLNMIMNSVLQIIDKTSRQMITNVTRGVEKTIDNIPVVNILKRILDRYTPLQSILQTVETEMPFLMQIVNTQIDQIFGPTNSFFVETTPKKFLFEGIEFCKSPIGIASVVCSSVEERNSPSIVKSADGSALKFSMFHHKNSTHDGLYEINTGIRRLDRLLRIERWNNGRTLRFWKSDKNGAPSTCQFINGTDGTAAAPFREEHDNFYIYASDICRSVQLFWEDRVTFNGIRGYRYAIRDNFLNEMPKCFCINKIKDALIEDDGCLYKGAIDLTECLDAPIVGTMPHFLDADVRYGYMIEGLTPSPEKHSIFTDIEPNTGSPLRGGKKLQFNMFLKKIDEITLTNNFNKSRLFPVLWVDEGIELNDEMTELLKNDLVNVLRLIDILQWTFVGIGAALIVGMLIWYFIARNKKTKSLSVEPIFPPVKGENQAEQGANN